MDDLELQRLEAVADAARRAFVMAREGKVHFTTLLCIEHTLDEALNALDKGREVPEMECAEYNDSPRASTGASSSVSTTGYWHFPDPGVSDKDKVKPPIRVVPLKQGFLVVPNVFEGYADDDLAFTDAFDLVEWLLDWLGFGEEVAESICDRLWDADELIDRVMQPAPSEEIDRALDVVMAAQAYVEPDLNLEFGSTHWVDEYSKLVEAVKKWRGIEGG